MKKDTPTLGKVIEIDEARIRDHLGKLVRGSVEDTLNALLNAEADQLCNAACYQRTQARRISSTASIAATAKRSGTNSPIRSSWR